MTDPTTPTELLACPFCGAQPHRGQGKVQHDQLHGEPFQRYLIWCPHRCARIDGMNEFQAVAAWNTRAPTAPASDGVELRERVAKALYLHEGHNAADWEINQSYAGGWKRHVSRDRFEFWLLRADAAIAAMPSHTAQADLDAIAEMMNKYLENWPQPKKLKTAIALIDQTLSVSREEVVTLEAQLTQLRSKAEGLAGAVLKVIHSMKHCPDKRDRDLRDMVAALQAWINGDEPSQTIGEALEIRTIGATAMTDRIIHELHAMLITAAFVLPVLALVALAMAVAP